MKASIATSLLMLATQAVAHAIPATPLDTSYVSPLKRDNVLEDRKAARPEPLQTLYIRNGLLVGDKLGYFNDSIAKNGAMDIGMNQTHLALAAGTDGIPINGYDVDLLNAAAATVVIAALVCVVIPGCPAYIAGNLGFGATAEAVRTVTAAAAGTGIVEVNKDTLIKRDNSETEKWSCVIEPGWNGACTNQAIVPGFVNAIGQADNADPTTYGSTYWQVVDASDGTVYSSWYHCNLENGDCPLIGDGAPTAVEDLGSAEGH